jgi:hypothetical protein
MQDDKLLNLNVINYITCLPMIPLGIITLIPNMMCVGSGNNELTSMASNIGVLSSYIFIVGGLTGSYKLGLVAISLQLSAFGLLLINEKIIRK